MIYFINTRSTMPPLNLMTIFGFLTLVTTETASSTITVRPSTGRATLIPGQPLHFQCETVDNKNAEFLW